eukprot:TRINITY_DN27172_c0_g5_i3.p1 TRINITY_DN27172_c0_g5~~TRINITY_DN27172_c0_g5_i3.p1  ORF type:complete len:235 (-),score=28.73 TRINITY_DN27172_c0_g5_i3:146-850(-)
MLGDPSRTPRFKRPLPPPISTGKEQDISPLSPCSPCSPASPRGVFQLTPLAGTAGAAVTGPNRMERLDNMDCRMATSLSPATTRDNSPTATCTHMPDKWTTLRGKLKQIRNFDASQPTSRDHSPCCQSRSLSPHGAPAADGRRPCLRGRRGSAPDCLSPRQVVKLAPLAPDGDVDSPRHSPRRRRGSAPEAVEAHAASAAVAAAAASPFIAAEAASKFMAQRRGHLAVLTKGRA